MQENIKWLLQDVGINNTEIDDTFSTIKQLKMPYANIGTIPFTTVFTNLENVLTNPTEKLILRTGTKPLSVFFNVNSITELNPHLSDYQKQNDNAFLSQLRKGLFYNKEAFDQAVYAQYDLPLLNNTAQYVPYKKCAFHSFSEDKFIKPSTDQKAFNAGILKKGKQIQEFVYAQTHQSGFKDELIVIADCKKIYAEYRFFVVNGQIITGSQYRNEHKLHISDQVSSSVFKVAQAYAKLYQPHDIFTLDIADTPQGYKIVEYNCWACSGLYACDRNKLFSTVHDYVAHH